MINYCQMWVTMGLIILTDPLKTEFMSKYQKNIGPRNKF